MTEPENPLRRLQQSLILQDVYVRTANATILGEFDPKDHSDLSFSIQLRFAVESSQHKPNRDDETLPGLVRYFIDTGLRFVPEDASESDPAPIAEITAVFVVDYEARDPSAVTPVSLETFHQNAMHHVWPFWREFIHTSSGRLRLPSVILPIKQPLKRPENQAAQLGITDGQAPSAAKQ